MNVRTKMIVNGKRKPIANKISFGFLLVIIEVTEMKMKKKKKKGQKWNERDDFSLCRLSPFFSLSLSVGFFLLEKSKLTMT